MIIIAICSFGAYFSQYSSSKSYKYHKPSKIETGRLYKVMKVIDGDSFDIKVGSKVHSTIKQKGDSEWTGRKFFVSASATLAEVQCSEHS